MFLHDTVGDRKSQPRALTNILGGKERFEDVRQHIVGNPRAVVRNIDLHVLAFGLAEIGRRRGPDLGDLHADDAVFADGLQRVDQQIGQHLLQLAFVRFGDQRAVAIGLQFTSLFLCERRHDLQRLTNQFTQIRR
jgi:hypothetical protein